MLFLSSTQRKPDDGIFWWLPRLVGSGVTGKSEESRVGTCCQPCSGTLFLCQERSPPHRHIQPRYPTSRRRMYDSCILNTLTSFRWEGVLMSRRPEGLMLRTTSDTYSWKHWNAGIFGHSGIVPWHVVGEKMGPCSGQNGRLRGS